MSDPTDSTAEAVAKTATPSAKPAVLGSSRAPAHNIHSVMNFEQLIAKVHQAEDALEARERQVVADWRRLGTTWRAAWTPGRIVLAGLASGFAVGALNPGKILSKGGGLMQLVSMLSGLFASEKAHTAASKAEEAADTAEDVADVVAPSGAHASTAAPEVPR